MSVAERFVAAIGEAERALSTVTEAQAGEAARADGWLRKEELGHLLDSVQNNHQRIVLAALDGNFAGPDYAQREWVDLHGYREMPWAELLAFWSARNRMLARVVTRITEEQLDATVVIGGNAGMSLRDWIDDYLHHLAGHVKQITGGRQ